MGILFYIIAIFLEILSGVLAWNIVEPDSFGAGIIFLLLWGLLGTISHYVSLFIAAFLSGELFS